MNIFIVSWNYVDFSNYEIAAIAGVVVFFCLTFPALFQLLQGGRSPRFSIIERHRVVLKNESMQRHRRPQALQQPGLTFQLGRAIALLPDRYSKDVRQRLRAAGFSSEQVFYWFFYAKALALLIFAGPALFTFSGGGPDVLPDHTTLAFFLTGALSFFGVDVFVTQKIKKRAKKLAQALPDGLDLLVICAEAGLSLDSSLRRVAEEFVTAAPELSEELFLTSVELNFLPDRRQALVNLAQRVDTPILRGVTSTLIQTEKYGTPLAQSLRTLSAEFREIRLIKAEEKAARLPAILTVPLIFFIFPALFIVLAAPAVIQVIAKLS